MDTILLIARLLLAAVFVTAAIGKLMDLSGSVQAVTNFGVPARFAKPIGYGLPLVEILVAILLIPVSTAFWGALLGVLLLLAFIGGMVNSLRKGETPDCHCFGAIHSEPISRNTIIRNGGFVLIGLFILAGGTTPGASVIGWLDAETGVVKGLVVAVALLTAAVAGLGWMTMHLLGQNGRLLIRMDELEAAPGAAAPVSVRKLAPAFTGTGLIGERVTLDTLQEAGKPILLFFSDPACGPCNALLPDIGKWQSELTDTTLAVVTRGTIDQAREKLKPHDIQRVAIENDRAISNLYGVNGTPAAVLIDRAGYVASDVAGGGDNIRKLVENVKSGSLPAAAPPPPPQAPAAPRGLALGEAAPDFSLPGRGEETVTTTALRDDPHVLIFWNPGCGFCKRMQPDLHEWAGEYAEGAVSLVLITSGNEEQASEYTFARQIGFDQGFNTGRLFGASGTPSGVLINADGTVGSQLAVGGPSIMELLRANSQAGALRP
jgi:thiol-disulfide isomerase/thioredoxin